MSAKIDKAAANVFGEDLVKIANIAGMAYGIYNGGFQIDGVGTEAVLAERALESASTQALSASAADLASAGDPMAAVEASIQSGAPVSEVASSAGDYAKSLSGIGAEPTSIASAAPSTGGSVIDKLPPPTVAQAPSIPTTGAKVVPTVTGGTGSAGTVATADQSSFFGRLKGMATDPKFAGEALKGITSGYGQAAAAQAQQDQYDQQRNDKLRRSRIGTFSLKG
jgi:hypothetical protein